MPNTIMWMCLMEMVPVLEGVLTPSSSNCSAFWLNSVFFSQCPMPSCKCVMEMVLALESVLTPSNCSTFWLNSVLFSECPVPSCDCVWRRWSWHWRVCWLLQIAQCFGLILCCFPSVQCHHATVFDGDGPGTGECADSFKLLNVLA